MNSKSALAVARMELPLFLCVWKPVEGPMVEGLIALAVGMPATDVMAAIFLPTPPRRVTTP